MTNGPKRWAVDGRLVGFSVDVRVTLIELRWELTNGKLQGSTPLGSHIRHRIRTASAFNYLHRIFRISFNIRGEGVSLVRLTT